jgi:Zn-dependent peptidase ImmA (M78 family)
MVSKSPRRPRNPAAVARAPNLPSPGLLQTPEQVIHYYDRMGLEVDSSIPVEEIIESNPDLDLRYVDLGINDAYIKKIPDSRFEIGVNSKHHKNRQRFSMAHEYGHYLLHRDEIHEMPVGEQILHRNGDRNRVERQANSFAAELLMPEDLVRKAFRASKGSLKKMADFLGVSKESLRYRLETIGYKVS